MIKKEYCASCGELLVGDEDIICQKCIDDAIDGNVVHSNFDTGRIEKKFDPIKNRREYDDR